MEGLGSVTTFCKGAHCCLDVGLGIRASVGQAPLRVSFNAGYVQVEFSRHNLTVNRELER